jgi:hypothetical protein
LLITPRAPAHFAFDSGVVAQAESAKTAITSNNRIKPPAIVSPVLARTSVKLLLIRCQIFLTSTFSLPQKISVSVFRIKNGLKIKSVYAELAFEAHALVGIGVYVIRRAPK